MQTNYLNCLLRKEMLIADGWWVEQEEPRMPYVPRRVL